MGFSREDLLNETKLETVVVSVGNGSVTVSEISGPDYLAAWEYAKMDDGETDGNFKVNIHKLNPALLAYGIVDEEGNRIFTDDDIPLLAKRSMKKFEPVLIAIKRLNGLLSDEGNASEPTPDGSTSGE